MKKLLPWAAIVALLTGLALLPGPKAGASEVPAPTLTGVVACQATPTSATWTATFTITAAPNTGLAIYTYGGQPNAGTVVGLPGQVGSSGTFTFTVVDIPVGTTHVTVDVVAYDANGPHDVRADLPISGTCDPTPPVTVPTTPVPVPPAPSGLPPVSVPVAPPAVAPPATVQAPLAFTGAPIWPEVAVGLVLIALGTLLVRKSRPRPVKTVRDLLGLS